MIGPRRISIPVWFCMLSLVLGATAWGKGIPEPKGEKTVTTIISKQARPKPVSPEIGNPPFTPGVSILTTGGRFLLIPATRVFTRGGKEIEMGQLPVPCQARLWYQPLPDNNPNVLQIQVLKSLPGASTAWAVPQPQ